MDQIEFFRVIHESLSSCWKEKRQAKRITSKSLKEKRLAKWITSTSLKEKKLAKRITSKLLKEERHAKWIKILDLELERDRLGKYFHTDAQRMRLLFNSSATSPGRHQRGWQVCLPGKCSQQEWGNRRRHQVSHKESPARLQHPSSDLEISSPLAPQQDPNLHYKRQVGLTLRLRDMAGYQDQHPQAPGLYQQMFKKHPWH